MADLAVAPFGWERTALAVEQVKDRLRRATKALAQAGVPYAVVGGHAVAEWVGRVEEAAVRNTRDVGILIRRADLDAAKTALEAAGFTPPARGEWHAVRNLATHHPTTRKRAVEPTEYRYNPT
jgi:hypothetical protein